MMFRRIFSPVLAPLVAAFATLSLAQTDSDLRDELLALRELDQSGRVLMEDAVQQHGLNSPELRALWDEQSRVDANNMERLREIISEHGWPGQSMVGREAAIAAFLILQHAIHETQIEYLPLVQAAVEAGELEGRWLAMLQDRVLVAEGNPQIYGTQLHQSESTGGLQLYPIEDEANVDARRQELGMIPLAEYIERVRGGN